MGGARTTVSSKRQDDGRGRPWQDTRAVLNGVFWVCARRSLARLTRRAVTLRYQTWCIARFSSGSVRDCLPHCCRNWRKTCATAEKAGFESESRSSMPRSVRRKKGLCCRPYSPRQGQQENHGDQPTAMVFLSPCTWPAVRRMKQNSSNPPSNGVSSPKLPNA